MFKGLRDFFKKSGKTTYIPQSRSYDSLSELIYYGYSGENITPAQAMSFYRKIGALSTDIDIISDSAVQINPILKINGKFETEHELLEFLKKPNIIDTWSTFIKKVYNFYLITGNSPLYITGFIKTPPVELYSVYPQTVHGEIDYSDNLPGSYVIYDNSVAQGTYSRTVQPKNRVAFLDTPLKQLYLIKSFSISPESLFGDSLQTSIAQDLNQLFYGGKHNLEMLKNGARVSGLVNFKPQEGMPSPTVAELDDRKRYLREQVFESKGNIMVTAGDMDFKELGISNIDMDYYNLNVLSKQVIALRYNIPLPLTSLDASTFNNYSVALPYLYDRAVLPLVDLIFTELTNLLTPRYKFKTADVQITYDKDEIQPLMQRRLEQLKLRREINIETPNELRIDLPDREPLKGGDILYMNSNQIPLGYDIYTDDDDTDPDLTGSG